MKIVYPICCGIDVHKTFIVAVIVKSDSINPTYLKKRFSTFHNDLIRFRDWLISNHCDNVCMESTGKYWIPIYNILVDHIPNVVVANPKWVKAIKGEKDDNKDAKWIADLFKMGIVRSSFIPSKDIRVLRECSRYLFKLVNNRSSEKNRFQNALTVGNCNLDQVFSDVFGKSASSIVNLILSDNDYSRESIISSIHGKCKSSPDEILSAIEGVSFSQPQILRIKIIQDYLVYLDSQIRHLKPCLVQVAHAAIKDKNCPYYGNKHSKIAKHRGKKRAIIVIARKMLVAIYHMLKTGEFFNPSDLVTIETSPKQRIKYAKSNLLSAVNQLSSNGLSLEDIIHFFKKDSSSTPLLD